MLNIFPSFAVLSALLLFSNFGLSAEISNRTALIIGIGQYAQPDVPALSGVKADMNSAKTIAKSMGITEANIRVLQNGQATKAGILQALAELGESTAQGARTFVYFSGHGTRWQDVQAGGCVEGLLTYDSQVITNNEIAVISKKLSAKADKFIVMFDACHSGGVATNMSTSRSVTAAFTPKFYLKSDTTSNLCSQPSNLITRGLFGESTRLGALPENFVQITSSLSTEVSFDEPGKGGLATQGVRDCLLGKSVDLDASGAVSMAEVQQCAQQTIDQKLKNVANLKPHHVTVSGNRNLIPVQRPKPTPANPILALSPIANTLPATPIKPEADTQPVLTSSSQIPSVTPQSTNSEIHTSTEANTTPVSVRTEPEADLASIATLRDIFQQRNPKRVVDVNLSKDTLQIGKDSLDLRVKSSHDGYVYLIMLGSDAKSFYVLFPNGLDTDNRIRAKQTLRLPKPDWQVMAAGPAGTDHLLVMVSDSPRKLDGLIMAEPSALVPFTYALNTLGGKSALIDFLTGSGVNGLSESFGAKLLSIKERP